jgi:hypothetical protein
VRPRFIAEATEEAEAEVLAASEAALAAMRANQDQLAAAAQATMAASIPPDAAAMLLYGGFLQIPALGMQARNTHGCTNAQAIIKLIEEGGEPHQDRQGEQHQHGEACIHHTRREANAVQTSAQGKYHER